MVRYYANLLGNWVDITDDGTVENQDTATYFKENYAYEQLPDGTYSKTPKCYEYGYIHVQYGGKDYKISPDCIQIVTS